MKKSFMLAAVLAGTFTVFGVHNVAEATSELESERDNVQEQREEIQSELSGAEQDLADLMDEIEDIEKQIESIADGIRGNQEMMKQTEDEMEKNEAKVKELEEEIQRLEDDIEERFELLKNRASTYQRSGGPSSSYIEVILGAEGFSDFISRVLTISQIAKADNEFIETLEANQDELESVQDVHQSTLDELDNQMVELEGMQQVMEDQMDEQERLHDEIDSKREDQKDMISNLENQEEELAAEEASIMDRIEAERARQAAAREAEAEAEAANNTSNSSNTSTATNTSNTSSNSNTSSGGTTNVSNGGASGSASAVINAGHRYIGNSSYVFGGGRSNADIQAGRFDCSGYVSWAFSQIGVSLPASTDAMLHAGQRISASNMRPGDLVFFDTYKRNGHVAIYAGNGQFIGSQSSTGVAYASMNSGYWANNFRGVVVRVLN